MKAGGGMETGARMHYEDLRILHHLRVLDVGEEYRQLASKVESASKKLESELSHQQTQDTRIDQISKNYGRATCRSLCDRIQKSLPRELRDSIYDYILDERRVNVDRHKDSCECLSCDDPYGSGPNVPKVITQSALPPARLRSIDYMGALSEELGEAWYRRSTFVFDTCGSVIAFLGNSIWNDHLQPRTLIKHIEIGIKMRDLRNGTEMNALEKRVSNLEASLDALWKMKHDAAIDVVFETLPPPMSASQLSFDLRAPLYLMRRLDGVIGTLLIQQIKSKAKIRVFVKNGWYSSEFHRYLAVSGISPLEMR
tara:strand:+ start:1808 stop:2740 length:933 start_codon:yes stop_codon:yes gene_type:complete